MDWIHPQSDQFEQGIRTVRDHDVELRRWIGYIHNRIKGNRSFMRFADYQGTGSLRSTNGSGAFKEISQPLGRLLDLQMVSTKKFLHLH